jgi:hypothetical protein
MPRFFFHIRDGDELIEDPDGSVLPDLEAARVEAIEGARAIVAAKVLAGKLIDGQKFEITDESGNTLDLIPFKSALILTEDTPDTSESAR